jgi:O-antigen ligase
LRHRWSTLTVISVSLACLVMVNLVGLRLGFIELALCTFAAMLLRFTPRTRLTTLLPAIELAVMLFVLFGLSTVLGHSTGLFDASSLIERLGEWRDSIGALNDLSITKLLFGTGMIQHRLTVGADTGTWLDSMYLEVLLHIGIVGLAFLLLYYAWLYRYAVRWVQRTGSPLAISVTAVWSSLPALGVINLMYPNVSTYYIGLLLCAGAPSTFASQRTGVAE